MHKNYTPVAALAIRGGGELSVKSKSLYRTRSTPFFLVISIILSIIFAAPVTARDISDGLFVSADIQRYIVVGGLEEYTVPKPGWSAALGWTFPLGQRNEISAFFQSGHRVISGENPLVRTLDIIPLQLGAEWAFAPTKLFSFGLDAGGGFFYSKISHYETVVKLLSEELTVTTGFSPFFSAALHAGISLCDGSVQLKALAGIECISETEGLVPVPALSLHTRVYPIRAFRHARKPPEVVEVERIVEKEVVVEKEHIVEVEKERIVEVPVYPELPPFPFDEDNTAVIYFNTKEDFMRESVAGALNSVGAYLEAVPELTVVIEGNSAPFDSAKERYSMGLRRAKAVREYLLEHFNIASRRIRTTSAGSSRSGGIIKEAGNDAYTEFRCARILLDADSLDAANRRLSAERKTEAAEETDTADETAENAEAAEESAEASPAENVEENAENAGDAEYTGDFNTDADTPPSAADSADTETVADTEHTDSADSEEQPADSTESTEAESDTENEPDEQNSETITDSRDTIENTNGSNEPQGE